MEATPIVGGAPARERSTRGDYNKHQVQYWSGCCRCGRAGVFVDGDWRGFGLGARWRYDALSASERSRPSGTSGHASWGPELSHPVGGRLRRAAGRRAGRRSPGWSELRTGAGPNALGRLRGDRRWLGPAELCTPVMINGAIFVLLLYG